jgi:uncharacterized repeat protein (TIGR04138 family)
MINPNHPIAQILRRDNRYHFDAYLFVFESLRFAQEKLGMGIEQASETSMSEEDAASAPPINPPPTPSSEAWGEDSSGSEIDPGKPTGNLSDPAAEETARHVSGQELCEAMRLYAHEQYGLLAKNVLNHWGIKSTSDFGEIVFNLIDIGEMRKTPGDRRADFDDVFDFERGFESGFEISLPE